MSLDDGILDRPSPGPGPTVLRQEEVEVAVIHGQVDGEPMTLFGCSATVASHKNSFDSSETWWPDYLLIGAHLDPAVEFENVMLRTEHLDDWAGTPGLERDLTWETDVKSVSFGTRQVVLEAAEADGWGLVEVIAAPEWSASGRRAEVSTQAIVRMTPSTAWGFETCMDRAKLLRGFLRTCIGAPTALTELLVTPSGGRTAVPVLFRTVAFGGKKASTVPWHDMPVIRSDLPGGLGLSLAAWEQTMRKHDQAWFRLCATDHIQLTNTDEAFVAYAKAIEALHSGDFDRPPAAAEEQDERIARVLAVVPEDLVDWAEQNLRENAKSPDARHRVVELVEATGEVGLVLTGRNPSDFAARVIATRNPLTHLRTKRTRRYLADDEARFEYGRALHYVGMAYLLHQLGTPLDHLVDVYQRHSAVSLVIDRMRKYERGWNAAESSQSSNAPPTADQ